ncbi:hypothetical protein BYT27DRAFT_7182778 [Phlegmacium glaucopus]|nr:hypothetical protein BYT27DRAFT_7182778 [Phlegmacium glaucopus]
MKPAHTAGLFANNGGLQGFTPHKFPNHKYCPYHKVHCLLPSPESIGQKVQQEQGFFYQVRLLLRGVVNLMH